uniref:Uncharacterized protein n=1 Tax=Latrodectus hesperus TaxID=256737 RepID=E7D1U2_LATHE|nr:hypothetical protein [Latrodectus hesperus]
MAFMMPVVKNDSKIYATSCPSSTFGSSRQVSRGSSLSNSSAATSLSSPRQSYTPAFNRTSKSNLSLHNFHDKVLAKLRKAFSSSKDNSKSSEDIQEPSTFVVP